MSKKKRMANALHLGKIQQMFAALGFEGETERLLHSGEAIKVSGEKQPTV